MEKYPIDTLTSYFGIELIFTFPAFVVTLLNSIYYIYMALSKKRKYPFSYFFVNFLILALVTSFYAPRILMDNSFVYFDGKEIRYANRLGNSFLIESYANIDYVSRGYFSKYVGRSLVRGTNRQTSGYSQIPGVLLTLFSKQVVGIEMSTVQQRVDFEDAFRQELVVQQKCSKNQAPKTYAPPEDSNIEVVKPKQSSNTLTNGSVLPKSPVLKLDVSCQNKIK
jgi:hypothetical protein